MRFPDILAALPVLAFAVPASAQVSPASAADVWDGVQACEKITETEWLHLKRLPASGWEIAQRRGAQRSTRKVSGIYEKDGNEALIVIGREELDDKRCVVLARLASTAAYSDLVRDLAELAGMPDRQDGFAYIWDRPGFTLRAEPSGKADEPNARFTITATGVSATAAIPAATAATPAATAAAAPSSSDGVLAALKSCLTAVGAQGFDGSVLTGAGWAKSTAQTASGADIDLYETAGSDVLITPSAGAQGGDVCLVRGKVADGATLDNIRAALTGRYGTPEADGGDLYWVHDSRVFYLMSNFTDGAEGPFAVQIPVSFAGESE